MKITIPKTELLRHKKSLKIARKGSLVPTAHITLTVAETCSIVGPGFSIKLDCRPHTFLLGEPQAVSLTLPLSEPFKHFRQAKT